MGSGNNNDLPSAAGELEYLHPAIWDAYAALGEATAAAGKLTARERRLVKLALAIGAASEGAVHSHARAGGCLSVSARQTCTKSPCWPLAPSAFRAALLRGRGSLT